MMIKIDKRESNWGDHGESIAVDSAGCAYITGETNSQDFPTTTGALKTKTNTPAFDAFVTKLNAAGSVPLFSTFLGGTGNEHG